MRTLSLAKRAGLFAIVVLDGSTFICVQRLRRTASRDAELASALWRLAIQHRAERVVCETSVRALIERLALPLPLCCVRLPDAAARLLGAPCASQRDLYDALVASHPQLTRFVRVLPATQRVATSDRRQTSVLIAAALGLSVSLTQPLSTCQEQRSIPTPFQPRSTPSIASSATEPGTRLVNLPASSATPSPSPSSA